MIPRKLYAPDQGNNNAASGAAQAKSPVERALQTQQSLDAIKSGPETARNIGTVSFAAGRPVNLEIPNDTCIKRAIASIKAYGTFAYASGTPLISPMGVFSRLVPSMSIIADGARYIKTLDLYVYRLFNALAWGSYPVRTYRTGAGIAATTRLGTIDWRSGPAALGATTQDAVFNESCMINFEIPQLYKPGHESVTQFFTANVSKALAVFNCSSADRLLEDGNTAPLVISSFGADISMDIIENREGTVENNAFDFVETVTDESYQAPVSQKVYRLNTGNKLAGIGVFTRNGDTNQRPSDIAITDLTLKLNGSKDIQTLNFLRKNWANKDRYSIGDDSWGTYVSGGAVSSHPSQGFAYINLIKNGDISSGLGTKFSDKVSDVQLLVTTALASGVDAATYTNPVQMQVLQQMIAEVQIKQ